MSEQPVHGGEAADRRPVPTLLGHVLRLMAPMVDPALTGFVDRIIGDEAVGWAFDTRRPQRRALVVARLNGRVVAETLADLPRRDLAAAGRGDGRCGFRLRLPPELDQESRAKLRIEAVAGLRRQRLKRGRRFRQEIAEAPRQAQGSEPDGPSAGFLERFSGRTLRGWAVDPTNPETPPEVDVFDGELFLGSVRAEIDRPRLREGGAPFGARGFEFQIPEGREVVAERLRARIAGTRFDLRHSRVYPGDGAAPRPPAALRPPPAPARPAAPGPRPRRIGLIVVGPGTPEAISETLGSWRRQSWGETDAAVLAAEPASGALSFTTGDAATLRAWIATHHSIVFLAPGQIAAPQLAAAVAESPIEADVVAWPGEGAPALGLHPRIALRRQGATAGLAMRAAALAGLPAALAEQGLGAVAGWALGEGWRWVGLDRALAGPAAQALPPRPRPAGLRRLSIAVTGGWDTGAPPALAALLDAAADMDVEVLVPAQNQAAATPGAMPAHKARSLTIRLVDAPAKRGPAAARDAFGRAATGQVVVFSDGATTPKPGVVAEAMAWALEPAVGAVRLAARSPAFVVSRRALAELEPVEPDADPEPAARLAAAGRAAIVLELP